MSELKFATLMAVLKMTSVSSDEVVDVAVTRLTALESQIAELQKSHDEWKSLADTASKDLLQANEEILDIEKKKDAILGALAKIADHASQPPWAECARIARAAIAAAERPE